MLNQIKVFHSEKLGMKNFGETRNVKPETIKQKKGTKLSLMPFK